MILYTTHCKDAIFGKKRQEKDEIVWEGIADAKI